MNESRQKNLEWIIARTDELAYLLSEPETMADLEQWKEYTKQYDRLLPVSECAAEFKKLEKEQHEWEAFLNDSEMSALAREEIAKLKEQKEKSESRLNELLSAESEDSEEKVILEIRAGAGGEEAALFAAMLTRMYTRYAERRGWTVEMLSVSDSELGGVKEAVFSIYGKETYRRLCHESGVHRIQRIPVTESNGKRQTSTATVAVLREVSDVELEIRDEDIRTDLFRATGHGGQHINKTDSAVRLTHIPTGMVVTCQDERSQLRNKEKAMEVLRARLYAQQNTRLQSEYAEGRKQQVGTGERSERVRTYNFNEGRITDHRIGKTVYNVNAFIDGDMDAIIDSLIENAEAAEAAAQKSAE